MKNLRRRYLPNFATLDNNYNFDVDKLLQSYYYSINKNKQDNLNHHFIINSVENKDNKRFYGTDKSGYEQVNLTSFNEIDSSDGYDKATWQWWNSRKELDSKTKQWYYRKALQQKLDGLESTFETSYNKINSLSDEYLKSILNEARRPLFVAFWTFDFCLCTPYSSTVEKRCLFGRKRCLSPPKVLEVSRFSSRDQNFAKS